MQPNRLLDDGATDFERWVLETARNEKPDAQLDQRMLSALSGAALGASVLAASSGAAKAGLRVGKWSLVKWGAGIAGITGVALTAFVLGRGAPEPAGARAPEAKPQAALVAAAVRESEPSVPSAPASPALEAPVAPSTAQQSSSARASAAKPVDPLKDELALLQRVRSALAAERAGAALTLLAQYERRHPRGQLRQEATVLRVQALEARGKQAQADRLAEDFLEKNPTSAHAPQIERARATP